MKNLFTKLNKNIFLMMCLFMSLTVIISSCGDDDDDDMEGPSTVLANFMSQVDADNSLTYNFTNNSAVNGITDRSFTSAWEFGDGGTSTEDSPTYTYANEGTFTVTLTVTASDGQVGETTETIEVTAPINRYAVITDSFGDDNLNADGNTDTGELRLATDSIQTGRITFIYRVTEGPVDMDIQDGFINVSGSSTTGDFALVEVRLKDDAPNEFREGASDAAIASANFNEGMADVWIPVEVSWSADQVSAPTFSLNIDGQTVITDAVSTTNGGAGDVDGHLAAVIDGAANFQFKYGGNANISDGQFQVDDIVIYSSDSGTETVVFEDNFQGRVAGSDLNPGDDPAAPLTPYHPNTTDASVGEDQ
ncbi:PKD domain-containing protein [Saprospiraceae bacterium]|nr:PKD domain-containing protein [Saprospiraceae bacterium]